MPQSAQIRCWLPLNPIRQTSRQRRLEGARELGELAFTKDSNPLLLHQLGDSNRILNEGMRHVLQRRRRRLHSPIKAAQHSLNTPSNDPPELGRIARLPVLFLIGAFVLQWLAFSLRRIACVRGLSCFQTCLSWGVMQSACPRQSGKRTYTFPTDHADVSVCPCQLAEQGHATVAWWPSFFYDEAYDPSS